MTPGNTPDIKPHTGNSHLRRAIFALEKPGRKALLCKAMLVVVTLVAAIPLLADNPGVLPVDSWDPPTPDIPDVIDVMGSNYVSNAVGYDGSSCWQVGGSIYSVEIKCPPEDIEGTVSIPSSLVFLSEEINDELSDILSCIEGLYLEKAELEWEIWVLEHEVHDYEETIEEVEARMAYLSSLYKILYDISCELEDLKAEYISRLDCLLINVPVVCIAADAFSNHSELTGKQRDEHRGKGVLRLQRD